MPKMAASKNVVITNRTKQLIPLQVKPPKGDFFYEEHQIRLMPGKSVSLPKHYLNQVQIENCQSRGFITVTEQK